ncbi:glycosyltransferase [uncultured Tolumonas sp.]|uniref:glycosyltransferase n=1 Tax=uncultured Tolumonas sp. TaxID=263765 RepID=UPI002A0A26F2|nr:glycosyltransferase [uncultured Tolumonas sp.]
MIDYPKVSLFVLCYQQAGYVAESIHAALSQDYPNLQVVISDDASTDETYSIIRNIVDQYQGQHRVIINRNDKNLGIGFHFKKLMSELVDGELIVASAGDDLSESNRVSRIVEVWLLNGKPDFIAHGLTEIDERGNLFPSSRTIQYRYQQDPSQLSSQERLRAYIDNPYPLPFIGAAVAYRADLYRLYSSPVFPAPYEDHLMYFRAILAGRITYFDEPLIKYRRHRFNFSGNMKEHSKAALHDIRLGLNRISIPDSSSGELNLHHLCCQQWCDYVTSVHLGIHGLNTAIASSLWQQLELRHQAFVWSFGSTLSRVNQLLSVTRQWIFRWKKIIAGEMVADYSPVTHSLLTYLPTMECVIFGAGRAGELTFLKLPAGIRIKAFIDNDKNKQGKLLHGIPIFAAKESMSLLKSTDCVIVASMYYHEIKSQLIEELNVPCVRIARSTHADIINPPQDMLDRPLAIFLLTISLLLFVCLLIV